MNNMVDIHNHSLPGVDDGAKTMDEAIENIKFLKDRGFDTLVLTSHYIANTKYSSDVQTRKNILEALKKSTENLGVKLYLGNEVYINRSEILLELLQKGEITTLNGSKYILIELPLHQRLRGLENVICELNGAGLIPIVAHPERYSYIQKDYDKIFDLLEFDCRLQINLTSLNGFYGSKAKKMAKKLLKDKLVSFIATDFHHIAGDGCLDKSLKKLRRYMSEQEIEQVLIANPQNVLNNGYISAPQIKYREYK